MAGPSKKELQQQLDDLEKDYSDLAKEYYALSNRMYDVDRRAQQAERKKEYAGSIAFDYWPPSDWFRLKLDKYHPGRYFQLEIGPIRIDWQEV